MHSNIETTIDRFLAEVVERGTVTDLEPLRTRIVNVESRPVTTEPATIERVDLTLEDSEVEANRFTDGVF
jgi:hypothetical protein